MTICIFCYRKIFGHCFRNGGKKKEKVGEKVVICFHLLPQPEAHQGAPAYRRAGTEGFPYAGMKKMQLPDTNVWPIGLEKP
jgi:hypothetical protein